MSTRATYCFLKADEGFSPKTTLYIHQEGYPEGAAEYFRKALALRERYANTSLLNAFFRENPGAEITRDHEAHFDTQYRYTIDPDQGTVRARERVAAEKYKLFYSGPLAEFVAQYLPVPTLRFTTYHPDHTTTSQDGTEAEGRARLADARAQGLAAALHDEQGRCRGYAMANTDDDDAHDWWRDQRRNYTA